MFDARGEVIDLFEKEIFLYKDNVFKTKEESEEESEENKLEKIKDDYKKFIKYIENKSKGINYELFEKHFNFVVPTALLKQLYETINRKQNYKLVNVIKSGLSDLKDETKKMSEDEKKKADKIFNIVENILNFNKEIQNQSGQGLKILTPNQMLSRLPISLARLKAGNNSEKLKNEIRQILYFL